MRCKYFHKITNLVASSTDSTLTATFDKTITVNDHDRFCFKLATTVPSGSGSYSVLFTINGVATNVVMDKYGNPFTGSDLNNCKLYCGYYGASTPHVIVSNYPKNCNCNC